MVPLAYLIGMAGMIFTAFSYWRMAEVFPIAGSVYAYTARGLNKDIGFLSGWAILLDYILVPALLYVVSASALKSIVPGVPSYVWIITFILINTVVNILGIEFTARFNKIMLIFELIVFAIFVGACIIALAHGAGDGITFKPFYNPAKFDLTVVMGAVSIAVLSFLGFDGISTLAEETKGGTDSVGKACVGSLLLVGALFIVQTYFAGLVFPDYTAFKDIDNAFYEVAFAAGGKTVMWICAIATGISWGIANSLAAQAAISRILYSMSRDGFLPHALAKVHPKYKTPYISTLFVAAVSVAITAAFANSIAALSSIVNFGALTSFLVLNFTVVYYFLYRKKSKEYGKHLILPVIGFIVIGYVWLNLSTQAKTLGLIWMAIGVVYLLVMKYALKKDVDLEV